MRCALTRAVSPTIVHCELTHRERTPIDPVAAARQHQQYEGCLAALGCRVIAIAPAPELPDAVFVEDAAVVLDRVAVITRPGAESRRAETAGVADALKPFRPLHYIEAPGALDGGDVLLIGRALYVGRSSRSNADGHAQLATIVSRFGYHVQSVDFDGCLHLKSAITSIADNVVLANPAFVDTAQFIGCDVTEVHPEEPDGANALRLDDVVVYPSSHENTRRRIEQRGLKLWTVDISELVKAEAGVTCCSLIFDVRGD